MRKDRLRFSKRKGRTRNPNNISEVFAFCDEKKLFHGRIAACNNLLLKSNVPTGSMNEFSQSSLFFFIHSWLKTNERSPT